MGVDIAVWRCRIGQYLKMPRTANNDKVSCCPYFFKITLQLLGVIAILLIIGNIEQHPGPDSTNICKICQHETESINYLISHQQVHAANRRFRYYCPWPTCGTTYKKLSSLRTHFSRSHQDYVGASEPQSQHGVGCRCPVQNCQETFQSIKLMCSHVFAKHLDLTNEQESEENQILCPIPGCTRTRTFKKSSTLRTHLSQSHPGWQDMQICAANRINPTPPIDEYIDDLPNSVVGGNDFNNEDDFDDWEDAVDDDVYSSEDEFVPEYDNNQLYSEEQLAFFIAEFYLKIEAELVLPQSTVQKISDYLTFLSMASRARMRSVLEKTMKECNISTSTTSQVLSKFLISDVLYNVHHISAPGPTFSTKTRRENFYAEIFDWIKPKEINCKIDPHDRSDVAQYIPLKKSLALMLKDPTVQKQILESWSTETNPNIVDDFTSGTSFKSTEEKVIYLNLFQDEFNLTNPLGSSSKKHKTLGMYFSIGNLKPHLRSRLKSMRLVMLLLSRILESAKKSKKVFKYLIKDLNDLYTNGIEFLGEVVKVKVQFLFGDNLGQHMIGGFVPAFNIEYFCRFCEYTKSDMNQNEQNGDGIFTERRWRTPESYEKHLRKVRKRNLPDYKGVRSKSQLNGLNDFHVCDSRLVPCIAHDLFIGGVFDRDLAAIIRIMANTKKWFSYNFLNMRLEGFKCHGVDQGNKPAKLHTGKKVGKKLGGHAVQNWLLIRLLPLLIGDKIKNTKDPVWQFYLCLKKVCEHVCAPKLTKQQIEDMKALIIEYFVRRKEVFSGLTHTKLRPKHHFYSHHGILYERLGPLVCIVFYLL